MYLRLGLFKRVFVDQYICYLYGTFMSRINNVHFNGQNPSYILRYFSHFDYYISKSSVDFSNSQILNCL